MAAKQEEPIRTAPKQATTSEPGSHKIDPAAPAGSEDSLGEESVRDGRPTTDDDVVEAIDEETPAFTGLPDR